MLARTGGILIVMWLVTVLWVAGIGTCIYFVFKSDDNTVQAEKTEGIQTKKSEDVKAEPLKSMSAMEVKAYVIKWGFNQLPQQQGQENPKAEALFLRCFGEPKSKSLFGDDLIYYYGDCKDGLFIV
ncbi:hypothetical protein ES708_15220 [subsurface metagenome]